MKIEKKYELFTRIVMAEVDAKNKASAKESESAFSSAVNDAVRTARQNAEVLLRSERYAVETMRRQKKAAAEADAKKEMIALRERLTEELFAEITAKVREFTESPAYPDYLAEHIAAANEGKNYGFVCLMPRDSHLADRILRMTGLVDEYASGKKRPDQPEDFIGGFRLISRDRRSLADHTLLARIERARENFPLLYNSEWERGS
jgi:vacuolar-type H+-ATPase subunit E/Vma4